MLGHPPKTAARAERGQEIESQNVRGQAASPERFWLAALDDFRNWLIREAA